MVYYALYDNKVIKGVFSSQETFNKWIRLIFHQNNEKKSKKNDEDLITYHCVCLESLTEDENYSIYLMHTKTDEESHHFYSTIDEAKNAIDEFIKKYKYSTINVFRIIIDYPYWSRIDDDNNAIIFQYSKGEVL